MAQLIASMALKPGMVVTSQRTVKQVYSFGTDLSQCRKFPMKGKAMVLREMTKVRLRRRNSRWNPATRLFDEYDTFVNKNMVLLSHYKHGLVMYFVHREDDATWRLIAEKETEIE